MLFLKCKASKNYRHLKGGALKNSPLYKKEEGFKSQESVLLGNIGIDRRKKV